MIKLEDLKPGIPLVGLEPASIATVAAVVPIGEGSVQVFYRTADGGTKERLLGRADEENLSIATVERPWSFDGDGAAFQLTCEAKRIDLAFLFDPMMAVHTANVEAAKKAAEGVATGGTSSDGSTTTETAGQTTGGTSTSGGTGPVGPVPTPPAKPKSFHGSIQIKPSTAKMHMVQVAEEIITLLAGDPNASLNITLEINAEFPSGASDQIKRAVSENATALGFKTKVWE